MKKTLTWIILLTMLLSCILLPAAAAEPSVSAPTKGLTFDDTYRYQTVDNLDAAPYTYSGWIRVPKDLDYTVILFGNYTLNTEGYVNFEVQSTGYAKISYTGSDGEAKSAVFNQVDVRTGEWLYLTMVHDVAAGEDRCYVNGTLRQTLKSAVAYADTVVMNPFLLGGDFRPANIRYFRGELGRTSIYSGVRTASQILDEYRNGTPLTDTDLIACYDVDNSDIGADIADLSANGNDLDCIKVWMSKEELQDPGDFAYSFAFIGDTQSLVRYHEDDFHKLYDWILDQKDEEKIEYVFGLGDITDQNTAQQWQVATQNIFRLNGVIPHSHIRGNHDGVAEYKSYMNNAGYTSQFEGFFAEGDWTNSWRRFSVGEENFLLLTLDYCPSDEVLDWACDLVEEYPTHKVIITTHRYMDHKQDLTHISIWDKLASQYENIFLVVGGHHGKNENIVWRQDEGVHGNTVTQVLIDPQEIDKYADPPVGMVALFHFFEDGSRIVIEYYSTVRGAYYKDINQFTIWLTEEPPTNPGGDSSEEESSTEDGSTEDGSTEGNTTESGVTTGEGSSTAAPDADEGCASSASMSALLAVLMLGAAVTTVKKKRS